MCMSSRMKIHMRCLIILLSSYVLVDSYAHLRSLPPLKVDEFTGTLQPLDGKIHLTVISFGKHKGKTYVDVYEEDCDYLEYVLKECVENKWNNGFAFCQLGVYAWEMFRRERIEVAINEQSKKIKAHASHVVGSGKHRPPSPCDSWKDYYEMFTGVDIFTEMDDLCNKSRKSRHSLDK